MPNWITSRPRLITCTLLGVLVYFLTSTLTNNVTTSTRLLFAWNVGVGLYLLTAIQMMLNSQERSMRRRALAQNDGEWLIMALVVLSAVTCLIAVMIELTNAKALNGTARFAHMGHAALTLASSWLFTQVMFAQQYANDYYAALHDGLPGGIVFPDEPLPDYLDFMYMSCGIGISGQTADVTFNSRHMRRICLLQGLVCFFFNTTVLALTVNMASSLI
jgi:uncharacterized membrane protein